MTRRICAELRCVVQARDASGRRCGAAPEFVLRIDVASSPAASYALALGNAADLLAPLLPEQIAPRGGRRIARIEVKTLASAPTCLHPRARHEPGPALAVACRDGSRTDIEQAFRDLMRAGPVAEAIRNSCWTAAARYQWHLGPRRKPRRRWF